MIQVQQLRKDYKDVTVLDIDQLEIPAGQSFGLVGNNGAGKTTLFRLLLDLIVPTQGQVQSFGAPVAQQDAWKSHTGSFLDESFLVGYLTPDEYFGLVGKLHGLQKSEIEERLAPYEGFFNDEIRGHKKYIRSLSKGNQKKVGIAAALLTRGKVIVLDEPFANLDPTTQIRLKQLLRQHQQEHQAMLLISSHDLNHVTEVCDRIVLLEKGKVVQDIATTEHTLQQLEEYFSA